MLITTTHNILDFDALASMVAVSKLYPNCLKIYSGLIPQGVRRFVSIYKESLALQSVKAIDLEQVELAVVVDTANPRRLPLLDSLWKQPQLRVHIYDHHVRRTGDLTGELEVIEPVGAAVTLLLEKIIAADVAINSLEATIMALGIYDDTGGLIFPSTTPRDLRAAAYLLEQGADLGLVERFVERPFSCEQRLLLQEYMSNLEKIDIHGIEAVLTQAALDQPLAGLDMVLHQLMELETGEVFFTLTRMGKKTEIIARSKTEHADVAQILSEFSGFGHARAAAAAVREDIPLEKLRDRLVKKLLEQVRPSLKVRDIMSYPVKSIDEKLSLGEAEKIMFRYGHTGMPVIRDTEVIGMISRRDVDKARLHHLVHAPVKGFMNVNVVSIAPDESVRDVQALMVKYDIGRLPVIENGNLIGIVSRSDILRTLHGKDYQDDHRLLYVQGSQRSHNYDQLLREKLETHIYDILRLSGCIAQEQCTQVYLVGGMVRDLLLGYANIDLDLVIEGDGHAFLLALGKQLGVKVRYHERFATGNLVLPGGLAIDVATARAEYYEFPAALPKVKVSSLREDLYRRDFTINTLALSLNPDSFGDITDFFGARADLKNQLIRVLYNFSFVEDPTRVLRAIRFAARYGFAIEEHTRNLLQDAVARDMLKRLSLKRIWHEIQLILQENQPLTALHMLTEYEIWDSINTLFHIEQIAWDKFPEVEPLLQWGQGVGLTGIEPWWLRLLILLVAAEPTGIEEWLNHTSLPKRLQQVIRETTALRERFPGGALDVNLKNSEIWQMVGEILPESALFMVLEAADPDIEERLKAYITAKKNMRLVLTGDALKQMGIKPGPVYSEIFTELYKRKLDYQLPTAAAERKQVEQWLAEGRF